MLTLIKTGMILFMNNLKSFLGDHQDAFRFNGRIYQTRKNLEPNVSNHLS